MTNAYFCQGNATEKFGIEFRSKLEAEWAYEIDRQFKEWDYVDSPWHDFLAEKIPIEIKPVGRKFFDLALSRVSEYADDWQPFLLCQGSPSHNLRHALIYWCDPDGRFNFKRTPQCNFWLVNSLWIESRGNVCLDGESMFFSQIGKTLDAGEKHLRWMLGDNGSDISCPKGLHAWHPGLTEDEESHMRRLLETAIR